MQMQKWTRSLGSTVLNISKSLQLKEITMIRILTLADGPGILPRWPITIQGKMQLKMILTLTNRHRVIPWVSVAENSLGSRHNRIRVTLVSKYICSMLKEFRNTVYPISFVHFYIVRILWTNRMSDIKSTGYPAKGFPAIMAWIRYAAENRISYHISWRISDQAEYWNWYTAGYKKKDRISQV